MFEILNVTVADASRAFGEVAGLSKKAFEVNIDPTTVLGALTGGYVAKRHYDKRVLDQQVRQMRQEQHKGGIEDDTYAQMHQLVSNLKVTFTPINVIYSVGGQTFEIIRVDEMTPMMKKAFSEKDALFFRDLLIRKMDMEMQLVQQSLANHLLKTQAQPRAGFQQTARLMQEAEAEFLEKRASEIDDSIKNVGMLRYTLSLDGVRPFRSHEFFTDPARLTKVASLFDASYLNAYQMQKDLEVGFLPDRVVYLLDGQMVEQLPTVSMNLAGIQAFQKRDRQFFLDFYARTAQAQEVEDANLDKSAKAIDEVVEDNLEQTLVVTPIRNSFRYFEDADIHPLFYSNVLEAAYPGWVDLALEAVISQIETDFKTKVSQVAFDKIAFVQTLQKEDQTVFMSAFTFEKFARAMVGKVVDFTMWQGGLELADVVFANEIGAILTDGENFVAFDDDVIEYTVNQVTDEGVRFMMPLVYTEDSEEEKDYYTILNGLLARLWNEADDDEDEGFKDDVLSIAQHVLLESAEMLNLYDIEGSIDTLYPQAPERVRRAVALHVGAIADAIEQLEVRRKLLETQLEAFKQDGGKLNG